MFQSAYPAPPLRKKGIEGSAGFFQASGLKSPLFPATVGTAKKVQTALRDTVHIIPLPGPPEYVAGVDAAFHGDTIVAVTCLYTYPELSPVAETFAVQKVAFPYIPGFLSFREGPALIASVRKLKVIPDVILYDGQGIAHPERFGLASHAGVLLDIPAIGCAKSRLIGTYQEPGVRKGQWSALYHDGNVVGAVLRTRERTRPVFISPGHRIDIKDSVTIVLGCTRKYRIPEPLRRADLLSRLLKKEKFG